MLYSRKILSINPEHPGSPPVFDTVRIAHHFKLTLPKAMWAFAITFRPFTFHILIFSSETPKPNELKHGRHRQFLFLIGCFF
jgi:hypothetical protein